MYIFANIYILRRKRRGIEPQAIKAWTNGGRDKAEAGLSVYSEFVRGFGRKELIERQM
jgi:hypothetical protein